VIEIWINYILPELLDKLNSYFDKKKSICCENTTKARCCGDFGLLRLPHPFFSDNIYMVIEDALQEWVGCPLFLLPKMIRRLIHERTFQGRK